LEHSNEHIDHTGHTFTTDDWKKHHHDTQDKDDPVLGHTEPLAKNNATCIDVVEEWHKWLFRIPAEIHPNIVPSSSYRSDSGIQNPVDVKGNQVTMVSFVPLKKKEDNVITIPVYHSGYILLGIMTAEACTEEYPSVKGEEALWEMVKKETDSVDKLDLKIDSVPRMGCFVERRNKLEISNVANENLMGIKPEKMLPNNTVGILYSGYWALLSVERLGAGDHLITIESNAKTYFIGATIALNILI
jgi:hypothetical protein